MSGRYAGFGLCFESELDLPELPPAPPDQPAVVQVRLERLPPPHGPGLLQQGADTFLRIRGVAYFRLRDGAEIAIDPVPGASQSELRGALLGPAIGALCYQRGLLPLHAGALACADGAEAFAGPSGVGKSTLVAYLGQHGRDVLCDDICAVSFDSDGRPMAWPGPPRVKLSEDALAWLGGDAAIGEVIDSGKYAMPVARQIEPRPLRRVYQLSDGPAGSRPEIQRLPGLKAIEVLSSNLFRSQFVAQMGLTRRIFELIGALARQTQVLRLARPRGFDIFGATAACLEANQADETSAAEADSLPCNRFVG
jgi:hypothetical protein